MSSTGTTTRVILARYKSCFSRRSYIISFILAFGMLTAAFVISSYAVGYATESASNPVTDLILSNVSVVDVDGIFVNGAMLMVLFMAVVCIIDPRRVPFVIKTIAVFVVIRSLFIILTHIGAFPTQSTINPSTQNLIEDVIGIKLYASFFLGNDSFFSGHTGLPFLMSLLYWDKKWIRIIFMATSVMFGIVVLLGHLHYTIDVLSAFFISYGIYRMARHLFPTDLQREQVKEYK
ncbi:MAG: phosphatase PAP2-related protein [bacterium]